MSGLPAEVLVSIFSFLDSGDLKIAALVCSNWRVLSSDDILWRRLCLETWRMWNKLPDKNETGWKKIYLYREAVDAQFDKNIDKLIFPKKRYETETKLIANRRDIWEKLVNESLPREKSDPNYWTDLSRRHWASMTLQKINQHFVTEKWTDFLANPDKYNIEDGAIWISQWKKPLLEEQTVYNALDALADQLRKHLGIDIREGDTLPESITSDLKSFLQRVCECFSSVATLNFKGNLNNYYLDDNSYIDVVLQKRLGIPITLSIVFAALCRRIGLKIDMIGIPQHFMAGLHDPVKQCTYYIDCFNARVYERANINDLLQFEVEDNYFEPVSAKEVYQRMFRNLLALKNVSTWDRYGHMLQFTHIGGTAGWRDKFILATIAYSSLSLYHEAIEMLENIKRTYDLPNTNLEYVDREIAMIKVKLRQLSEEVPDLKKKDTPHKFSVGDLVYFIEDDLTRVVIGYDPLCVPITKQMYGSHIDANTRQPYYLTINVEDPNKIEYIPQSYLVLQNQLDDINAVEDPAVFGPYFDRFNGQKFITNKYLAFLYP